ncbi:MAG TPA: nuclear transport factor 2 family protein [Gemmatimonadaceae bacterium]|nr:nuclear transport factor 2 family protein [Gemmatimonadaceae bacterium]
MRPPSILRPAALLLALACAPRGDAGRPLTERERAAVAAAVEQRLRDATDLRAGGDVVARMLSIYPDSGRVVSASAGQVTTSRDSLAASIATFWQNVGQNMRNPEWRWGPMLVDVLGPDAAVVTATYRIPHLTPRNEPHVIGGAWTAVFQRRDGRWVVVQEHLSDLTGPVSPTP